MPDKEKHTPGPWKVGVTLSDGRRVALVLKGTDMQRNHNVYRDVHATRRQIEEQEPVANARLVAAAPDLLAACEEIVEAVPPEDGAASHRQAVRASRAAHRAIAKARGSNDTSDSDLPDQGERGAADLTSAGEEIGALREENERLKERVAELEEACETVLKWVAHDFKSGLPIPEGTPDAGEAERILRDALPGENAPHEAEVSQ